MVRFELVIIALSLLLVTKSAMSEGPPQADDFILADRAALLHGLKLEQPELAAVKAALDKGDVEAAGKAYIAYFRTREIEPPRAPNWSLLERNPQYNTSGADAYLAGHLQDGYSVYEVPETGIDWDKAPLSCLTRFPIMSPLCYAAHHTREAKYARFIVDHIKEYMAAYPIEEFVGKNPKQGWRGDYIPALPWEWCMIPMRLSKMAEAVALVRSFPEVSEDELLQILQRMYEETRWLRVYIKTLVDNRHNGGCAWMGTVLDVCAVLDDFAVSDEWLEYNLGLLEQYIDEAFYPDGMCIELTTGYSLSVAYQTEQLAYAMRKQAGFAAAKPKLEAMIRCMTALGKPTGRVPSFGDGYAGYATSGAYVPLLEHLDLPWADRMIKGEEGPEPPFLVWPQPGHEQWCGYYTMRSDWTKQAVFMMIDCGPWGTSHQHGDKLSFVVSAYGADFIIDPSPTRYHNNEPDRFLSRQNNSFLHNNITVDGMDEYMNCPRETKEPLGNTWEHGEHYSLFAGSYSFAPVKQAEWERRVLFADKSYWLLQDVISSPEGEGHLDTAEIEQNFQFEKDTEIELQGNMAVATAPNGAQLLLMPLSGDLQPELTIGDKEPRTSYWPDGKPNQTLWGMDGDRQNHGRGWTGRWSNKLMPAPAVTYVGRMGLPGMITMALIPLQPGQESSGLLRIAAKTIAGVTTWNLPVQEGTVRFTTSADSCEVAE